MPRSVDQGSKAQIDSRNEEICELAQGGSSYTEITRRHDISVDTVENVLRQQGTKLARQARATPGRDPCSHDNLKALSHLHRHVGAKLDAYQTVSGRMISRCGSSRSSRFNYVSIRWAVFTSSIKLQ